MQVETLICWATPGAYLEDSKQPHGTGLTPEKNAILNGIGSQAILCKVTSATIHLSAETFAVPIIPETVEKLVVYQFPSAHSSFGWPSGLLNLHHVSLNGFKKLAIPPKTILHTLELTNCSDFRLEDLSLGVLHLEDCARVILKDNALPTISLKVIRVTFNIFAGAKLPSSLEELSLEETNVNKLTIPDGLQTFTTNNMKCKALQFGSFVITNEEVNLEGKSIYWDKNTAQTGLRSYLRTIYSN